MLFRSQFKLVDGDLLTQIKSLMDVFEPALDAMAEGCVICLNPKGTLAWLDVAWVRENIASDRQYNILLAQVELNKLRDFFSHLFQGYQTTTSVSQAAVQQ